MYIIVGCCNIVFDRNRMDTAYKWLIKFLVAILKQQNILHSNSYSVG